MSTTAPVASVAPARLVSLDVFRGLTVCLMIIVNNSGEGAFRELQHAAWSGWTATDLVFPSFLFITGVSLTFSFSKRLREGASKLSMLPHIFKRAAIIFIIGLLINSFPVFRLADWRIPGVLQRIAICYAIGSVLYLWTGTRTRWAVIAACLLGYWILMRFVPVPGFGIPTVDVPLLDPDRNLAAWLDRRLMMGHLYEGVRDPEGVLSTIPALANTLFGVAAGEWIRSLRAEPKKLLRRLVAVGVACFAAGQLWGIVFPINKKLWTSSYVLLTVGIAMVVLALCYWMLDVKQWRGRWTVVPLVFGTNCIFAYSFSEFVAIAIGHMAFFVDGKRVTVWSALHTYGFDHIEAEEWRTLAYALFFAAVCWFATWLLYRKKIFLKV